ILACNRDTFKDIVAAKAKYGLDMIFEIQRHGAKKDTKTTYSILPEIKMQLSAADQAHLKGLALLALDADDAADMNSLGAPSTPSPMNEKIDDDTRAKVVQRLKVLPKAQIDEFVSTFVPATRMVKDVLA